VLALGISSNLRRVVSIAVVLSVASAIVLTGTSAGASPPAGHGRHARAHAVRPAHAAQAEVVSPAYELLGSNGLVAPFGGAGFYGDEVGISLSAPIVGGVATADGNGYWLVGRDGGVFTFGDAHFEGSAGAIHLNEPIVGMAGTEDGRGYWLVASDGGLFTYGDARFDGSLGATHLNAPIVSMASTPDGDGYWMVAADGGIFTYGNARFEGSAGAVHLNQPIVGMARTLDDKGYWLVGADGGVFTYGDAKYYGSVGGGHLSVPIVSIASTPDGRGYWLVTGDGAVLAFGDATYRGDLQDTPANPEVVAIASTLSLPHPRPNPYPAGTIGYDINWPQCVSASSPDTVTLPGPPSYPSGTMNYGLSIVGVDGWGAGYPNSCLGAEAKWAAEANGARGAGYGLYILLNAPARSDTIDLSGPAGTCSADGTGTLAWQRCLAYNYGFNAADAATDYARSQGAASDMWWLDIENTTCSSSNFNGGFQAPWSCDTALNALTIEGAINALRGLGITPGMYSTVTQWDDITGGYVPPGSSVPIWIAGAEWTTPPYPASYDYYGTSVLGPWCAGRYDFAGGTPWILQETPGPNNYAFDPDYSCG
jgi:hypothetical protein